MRTIFLAPLTALVAVVGGCGSEVREQATGSVPQRDLTLVSQPVEVKIASSVETQQPLRAARLAPARRSRPLRPKVVLAAVAAPAAVPAAEPVAQPAPTPIADNSRELLPGKTVTVIPASSGSSAGPDETEYYPGLHGHTVARGGKCGGRGRGRGPGIGIATGPRPDFRVRR